MVARCALAFAAVVCALAANPAAARYSPGPVLTTPQGQLRGLYNPKSRIAAFKGIPFAEPPVGNLRFADPVSAKSWTGIRNATEFSPGCLAKCPPNAFPQASVLCPKAVSEDCLYLNVYTPQKALGARADKLPVMLFIHGGNYEMGAAGVPFYDGQSLATNADVVVVTSNYRLGILGALYTGTVKGNFQTKDQRQAMRWIRDNIEAFGGNKDLVTITGQSAGAASVAAHLSSPKSGGLFHRAIVVSDPIGLLAAPAVQATAMGANLLKATGCPAGGDLELECLRKVPGEKFINLTYSVAYDFSANRLLADIMRWVPVVDGDELPYQPVVGLREGFFNKVPVMMGTTANESVQFVYDAAGSPLAPFEVEAAIELAVGKGMGEQVMKLYGPIPKSQMWDAREYLMWVMTDYLFTCPIRWVADGMNKHAPTYVWYYDYLSKLNKWMFGKSMPYCVHNVCHAEDLWAIFFPFQFVQPPAGFPAGPIPDTDLKMIHTVQTAWGHFARTGSPNPLPQDLVRPGDHVEFPRYTLERDAVVNYSDTISISSGFRRKFCDFYDRVGYVRY